MNAAKREPRNLTAEELREVRRMTGCIEAALNRADYEAVSELVLEMATLVALADAPAGDA